MVPVASAGIVYEPAGMLAPVPSAFVFQPASVYPLRVTPVEGMSIWSPGLPVMSVIVPLPPLASYLTVTGEAAVWIPSRVRVRAWSVRPRVVMIPVLASRS